MQSPNAWTAVARGAVLRGLEGSILRERRSWVHYGTTYTTPFDPEKHPFSSRYWDSLEDIYRTKSAIDWFVLKNDVVAESRAISIGFYRKYNGSQYPSPHSLRVLDELYASLEALAPVVFDASKTSLVCTVITDLSKVPKKNMLNKTSKSACRTGRFTISSSFASTRHTWSFP